MSLICVRGYTAAVWGSRWGTKGFKPESRSGATTIPARTHARTKAHADEVAKSGNFRQSVLTTFGVFVGRIVTGENHHAVHDHFGSHLPRIDENQIFAGIFRQFGISL